MLDRKGNSYSNDAYSDCPAPYSAEFMQQVLRRDDEAMTKSQQNNPKFENLELDQIEQVRFDDVPTAPLEGDSFSKLRREYATNVKRGSTSSSASMTGLTSSHLQAPSSTTPPPYNPEFVRRVSEDDTGLQSGSLYASSSSFGTATAPDLHRSSAMRIAMFRAGRGMRALGKKVKDFDEEHHVVEKSKAAAVSAFRATKNGTLKGYQRVKNQVNERTRRLSLSSSTKD